MLQYKGKKGKKNKNKKGKKGRNIWNFGKNVQNLKRFEKAQVIIARNKLLERALSC